MNHKKKLVELYDKVGGVSAAWIETFQNVTRVPTQPLTSAEVDSIVKDLDDMADWEYDIADVRAIEKFERDVQSELTQKLDKLEKMIDELKSPKQQEKIKSEIELLLEAVEHCYITLGSNYMWYGDRYYELTAE